ncbi:Sulfite oxidase [Planctopirus limnophila DSM 3776]|uniref:Sulfite oxidase n=1 Tax=Planctopirus limnophila (strain ATCC 43296 / DSM 3776 / IFAM 1008 / Mu 290) TaxID=521674 RepID=D5SXC0_PLAL2|nr:sulfite oxidase [Planctopirus limnophila]ADG69742.1 Sulfite oxidase [Planctopirus limnophila DSM 3776]
MLHIPHPSSRRHFMGQSAGLLAAMGLWNTNFGQLERPLRADEPALDLISADIKRLITRQATPYNAEPPAPELTSQWLTPTRSLYVRSHGKIPRIDEKSFRLSISGLVERPVTFTLPELQERFPATSTLATMVCAGNRRNEFALGGRKAPGVPWDVGAIGTCDWQGVSLAQVLKHCGVKAEAKHIWFEGLDAVEGHGDPFPFGASIPLEKAMQDQAGEETLLAWGMNGDPLLPEHGFPLRNVVPGYIGARSVKWLAKIVVSDKPSPNFFVQDVYKVVYDDKPESTANAAPIMEFILNSAITEIRRFDNNLRIRGFALAQGSLGNAIERVEISTDRGKSWQPARIITAPGKNTWSLWSATIPAEGVKTVTVRAFDRAGNSQPESQKFNIKGYQLNSWHTLPVAGAGQGA